MPSAKLRVAAILIAATSALQACGRQPDNPGSRSPAGFDLRTTVTDPGPLDPALATTRSALLILKQICDPLVAFDQATGALKPALAESWTISDDAKTIRFSIRKGVKFSNGRDLTAADFVYSMTRLADPDTKSPHHYLLAKVNGYNEMRTGASQSLAGVTAPDPNTLQVELSEPFAEFPALMAHPAAGAPAIQEEIDKPGEDELTKPVCTGPYKIDSSSNGTIIAGRFDGYYAANGAFSDGGRGYANRLVFKVIPDLDGAFEQLADGKADVAPIAAGDLHTASQVKDRVESRQSGHVAYIGFPTDKPHYDKPEVRRKIAAAVDREAIVDDLLGGSRAPATGILPLSSGPVARESACLGPEEESNPEVPGEINLYFNAGGGHEAWLQSVVDDWAKGVKSKTTLKSMDWNEYIDFLAGPGADGPFRLSWAVTFPSPEAMLDPLFMSASPNNFSRYRSTDFDELMAKARSTKDDGERVKAYAEAAKLLCKDQPILPVWFGLNHVAFAPKVQSSSGARLDLFGDPILRELKMAR